jgi:hypothetical protein
MQPNVKLAKNAGEDMEDSGRYAEVLGMLLYLSM